MATKLNRKSGFKARLCMCNTKFHEEMNAGRIPPPDGWLGVRSNSTYGSNDDASEAERIGYWHVNFADEIDAVGVVACCKCVLDLGNEEVARTIGEMFVNEKCGGGTVEMVQGGVA